MDAAQIQDRVWRGMGAAARHLGVPHDFYRPRGPDDPLAGGRRVMRLPADFTQVAKGFGHPVWEGVFDAAYTRVGDYLAAERVFFVVAQHRWQLPQCVLANRTVSLARPAAPVAAGANAYGGVVAATSVPLLRNWPASVLAAGGRQRGELPSDSTVPSWSVLLPSSVGVVLLVSDLMSDDLGRNFTVASAEESELGWRLLVRQAEN